MLVPVILSGGAGSRLWPVSREAHPKPFMLMPDGKSLLHKTLERTVSLKNVKNIVTMTNRDYYFQTKDQYKLCDNIDSFGLDYLLEPVGRNTAPAIVMAAFYVSETYGSEAVMLVLPADHIIDDHKAFDLSAQHAVKLAEQGKLVTFGINPDKPETGYGYIEVGEALTDSGYVVKKFVEKPDAKTAESYVKSGDFVWNSGMFCFKPEALLSAMKTHSPEIYSLSEKCWNQTDKQIPTELEEKTFSQIPSDSIDYALMEKSEQVAVVRCDFDWNDVGSWDAVSDLAEADANGNRVVGNAILEQSSNCYVNSDGRLIAVLGLEDTLVIDTPDALLVTNRSHAQQVKTIFQKLKQQKHSAHKYHSTVHRPWGTYTVLEEGPRFKMKRIVLKPGASISLQKHHHRSEHWVVVSGTAEVVNGEDSFLVQTNESTYVPIGNKHRLSNPGVIELAIIEVQIGDYLEEDDIVRYEDNYGRK